MDDNPAARLASILQSARDRSADESALKTWMEILEAPNEQALPAAVAQLYTQQQRVVTLVMALPADEEPDHLLAHMPAVTSVLLDLMSMRSANMNHYVGRITGEVVYSMRTCAAVLRRRGMRDPEVSNDDLQALLALVRNLIDEIATSDIPYKLQILLYHRLKDVETALMLYKIGGFERLQESIDLLFGTAFRAAKENPTESGKISTWVKKVFGVFQDAAPGVKAIGAQIHQRPTPTRGVARRRHVCTTNTQGP